MLNLHELFQAGRPDPPPFITISIPLYNFPVGVVDKCYTVTGHLVLKLSVSVAS